MQALDEMEMDRAAISVNEAVVHLAALKKTLESSDDTKAVSAAAFQIIEQITVGLPIPKNVDFG
ncbi:hypothetical protein C8024_06000 [Sphingopyxis sp. BSNA05]|nr:hypothetical protein [Sphingopyxis sp. BSNA05]